MRIFRFPETGFTLVEALFAAALVAMAGGAFLRAVTAASVAGRGSVRAGVAAQLARAKLDELRSAPMYRTWPWPGYHGAVSPGGSVDPAGAGAAGYVAWFDEHGAETTRNRARVEVRWRIREASPGGGTLDGLWFDVLALPVGDAPGPTVRLSSLRVANGE